jgi:hypothetical protein
LSSLSVPLMIDNDTHDAQAAHSALLTPALDDTPFSLKWLRDSAALGLYQPCLLQLKEDAGGLKFNDL